MLSIQRDGKDVNIKRLGEGTLQVLVLESIKSNHPKKYEIVDYYFKKYKFKPHRVLNGEMSFIECTLKHDFDMLTKYVQDIDIKAPGYNVINACVMSERIDLLKKYIKKKGNNLNEFICNQTPLLIATKQKNKAIFDILIDNGCQLDDVDDSGENPFSYILKAIIDDLKNNVTTNKDFYLHAIRRLLPTIPTSIYEEMVDQSQMLKSPYLEFLINNNCPISKELANLYGNRDLLLGLTKQTNLNISGVYEHIYLSEIVENSDCVEYVQEILLRRPYLALRKYEKSVLMRQLCAYSSPTCLDFLIKSFHLLISQIPDAVFALLVPESLKWIKQMIEIYPNLIKLKNSENKNLIESVLLTDYENHYKIECLDYFKSLGESLTYCDEEGSNPLSIVIQHGDLELFTYILKHFDTESIKNLTEMSKNEYMSCPIIQACHYGKLDQIKLLVKQGFPVIMAEEDIGNNSSISLPACVSTILFRNNHDLLQYVIECPDFKIEREQRDYIFEFAKANKCSNSILSMFDEKYEELEETIDPEIIKLNGLLSSYFSQYKASLTRDNFDSNFRLISCLKTVLLVILKIIQSDDDRIYKTSYFNNASESFKKYFNEKYDHIDMIYVILEFQKIDYEYRYLQSHILTPLMTGSQIRSDMINIYKKDLIEFEVKFKSFGTMLDKLYKLLTECESENYTAEIDETCECCRKKCYCDGCGDYMGSTKKIHVMTPATITDTSGSNELYCQLVSTQPETFKGLKQMNIPINTNSHSPNSNDADDEINELLRVYHTFSLEPSLIDQLLSRVAYPFEAPNYHLLKQMLSTDVICTEQDNKYSIYNGQEPIATIYKNNKQNIPCWVEHYGYNICEKMDKNHMFPFGVDIIMHKLWNSGKIKCGYAVTDTSKRIYIYGKVYMDSRWTRGYFEYFLNDKNILFHRLFKPLTKAHIQHKQI